jgi:transaldolase
VADHGVVRSDTIRSGYDDAAAVMATLVDVGIDYDDVVEKLASDGLITFQASWVALTETLERKLAAAERGGGDEDDPT